MGDLEVFIFLYVVGTLILMAFSHKNIYFMVDTIAVGGLFVFGYINSWNYITWNIIGYYPFYIFIRGLIALIIFTVKKQYKKTVTLNLRNKILIAINFIVNIITLHPLFYHGISSLAA